MRGIWTVIDLMYLRRKSSLNFQQKNTAILFSFSFFTLIFYFSLGEKETEVRNICRPQIICPTQHSLAFKFLITALDVLTGGSCYLEVQPCKFPFHP